MHVVVVICDVVGYAVRFSNILSGLMRSVIAPCAREVCGAKCAVWSVCEYARNVRCFWFGMLYAVCGARCAMRAMCEVCSYAEYVRCAVCGALCAVYTILYNREDYRHVVFRNF